MLAAWVERDGLARSVLVVLTMTTIACFAYTWGYYEVSLWLLEPVACLLLGRWTVAR